MVRADCFRFANYGTPLRALPGQRAGRFNAADDPPTQYLADHPLTPWAEFLRWSPTTPSTAVAVRLWTLRVDLNDLVHVDFDSASSFGISPERLVADDDYSDCRDLAAHMRRDGARGLVVPNAALPGTRSVVLFGGYVLTRYGNPSPAVEQIAGAMTADHARPPREIHALLRRRGSAHAALDAWKAGVPHELREPVVYAFP